GGASPSITAETPRPPNDSLYSLQPTRPSSVVILRKSKLRWPASACRCSILAIFIGRLLSSEALHRPARGPARRAPTCSRRPARGGHRSGPTSRHALPPC